MQVKHILHEKGRDVVALTSEVTLSEATRLLARKRIGALLVRDPNGALVGVLSERDVVRAVAEESVAALARPISAYMTRAVATCTESDTTDDLMEMMTLGRFRHVPVLDENQQLCGIVSIGDIVKSRIEETVREANTLRQYIAAAG
jgi:CBS domain-containing protein